MNKTELVAKLGTEVAEELIEQISLEATHKYIEQAWKRVNQIFASSVSKDEAEEAIYEMFSDDEFQVRDVLKCMYREQQRREADNTHSNHKSLH